MSTAGLRTTSLSRRVLLFSLAVLLVVLTTAGVLTDVLLGAQLRSDAAARLTSRADAAQAALSSGAGEREVAAAASGDGVTASLVTGDGTVVGNPAVEPPRGGAGPRSGSPAVQPPRGKGPTPPGGTTTQVDPQQLTRQLSDGSLLTVAVDTAGIADVRAQLRRVLVPLLAGALVLAGLLLLLATRNALRPLDRMTVVARSIARGQRGRRLDPDRTDTELGRTAAAFDEMLDALEGAEAAALAAEQRTRRFVADAAHELRTPLAGVLAASEVVLSVGPGADPAATERMQLLVVREARRAGRLVEDLLSLARIDSGLQLRLAPVDLRALVQEEVQRARLLATGLDIVVDAEACTVSGDEQGLAQVLTNLLDNTRSYVPRPGRVLVRVRAGAVAGAGTEVLVVDDGPGVPAADRERVFDRLVRLDDARTRSGGNGEPAGSGLGLAIARGTARAHGGELSCVEPPSPWTGAALRLQLPG